MKYSTLAVATLVSLLSAASSATWAQAPASAWRQEIARVDNATMPRQLATRYVKNANNCAPDQSRAVWGSGQVLLGYACYNSPMNR
jgi:hypothetical protein